MEDKGLINAIKEKDIAFNLSVQRRIYSISDVGRFSANNFQQEMKYLEYDLQCAVAKYLDDIAKVTGKLQWNHPPNEGKHKPQYRVKQAKAGMKAGEPDCIIYHDGKVLFIELKLHGNYLNPNQKTRHEALRRVGCPVYTVTAKTPEHAVEQVELILRKTNII